MTTLLQEVQIVQKQVQKANFKMKKNASKLFFFSFSPKQLSHEPPYQLYVHLLKRLKNSDSISANQIQHPDMDKRLE